MDILKKIGSVLEAKEKKRFRVLIFLDILISIVDIFSLAVLLWIVQFYIQPNQVANVWFLPAWLVKRNSVSFIAIFFFLFTCKNLLAIVINRRQFRFIGDVAVRISALNLSCYQQAGLSNYTDVDSSVQIRKIAFQPFEFCQYLLSGIQQIITQSFLIIFTLIAIILFNAKIFLFLLLLLLPPVAVVFYLIKIKTGATRAGIKSANEKSFQYLLDALKGYVEANIYGRNDFFMKRFVEHRKKFSTYLFDSLSIQAMPARIIEVFAVSGLFILIVLAQWSGNDKGTLLTIGAFMVAAYKVIPGLVKLINTTGQMKGYEHTLTELVKETETRQLTITKKKQRIHSIEFKNICFQYKDLPVLHRFNCHIRQGDFVGISGQSGKGKTTVLNLLLGFLQPANGEILINGFCTKKEHLKNYWPSIAYVKQQVFLINETIIKNITLEEEEPDKERLQPALHISGLAHLLTQFPERQEKMISENGKNISGGQQQRIALARALYKAADVYLLDEPFNELDEASEIILLNHFRKVAKAGKIVIMITHDKRSLSYCNKIISLDGQ